MSSLVKWLENKNSRKNQKRWRSICNKINDRESFFAKLNDKELKEQSALLRVKAFNQFVTKFNKNEKIMSAKSYQDEVLIDVYALVRESARRTLGLRPYDVQIIGAIALHEGVLAEMRTGEGKTLVIVLPVVYNAFCGLQPHVITVNEYLATRDSQQMEKIYNFLGLTVGLLKEGQSLEERQSQYKRDIVYGVNHEFGFDYLKDNMIESPSERRQKGLFFAVIDEVDSILIDEARTPLIITTQSSSHEELYKIIMPLVKLLGKDDVDCDLKSHSVWLTEVGFTKMELALLELGLISKAHHLYEPLYQNISFVLMACLKAEFLFKKDQQYIVKDGVVVIVDEGTGRLMPDRRWGQGIHQAVETKEGVRINPETKIQGQITYQNFFKLYKKLAGLTGTALTQKEEFEQMYGLHCEKIKTHKPMIRRDRQDIIYRTIDEKVEALVELAKIANGNERPVLIGTPTVEESELISKSLQKANVAHNVLNAKNHSKEAHIIAQAGCLGAITVATNMAGRGTDILLGGNVQEFLKNEKVQLKEKTLAKQRMQWLGGGVDAELIEVHLEILNSLSWERFCNVFKISESWEMRKREVEERWRRDNEVVKGLGGLLVLGSSKHDSRRVDNQLRGRAGRQGDPGESQFIISLEDSLFRIYGQNGFVNMIDKMNLMPRGTSLQSPMIERALERAQQAVEAHHFNARKQLTDFDHVGAAQRVAVYEWRNNVLESRNECIEWLETFIELSVKEVFRGLIDMGTYSSQWDIEAVGNVLEQVLSIDKNWTQKQLTGEEEQSAEKFMKNVSNEVKRLLEEVANMYQEQWGAMVQQIILKKIDSNWQEHLDALAQLLESIHLRSFAQKDPKTEYKREAFEMFKQMRSNIALASIEAVLDLRKDLNID